MTKQHPITLPPAILQKLRSTAPTSGWHRDACEDEFLIAKIAEQAAQWGADQELEACVGWLDRNGYFDSAHDLGAARRPKPLSLKQQALESLHHLEAGCKPNIDLLRRALEALPE
jgi:hypothetical protein